MFDSALALAFVVLAAVRYLASLPRGEDAATTEPAPVLTPEPLKPY